MRLGGRGSMGQGAGARPAAEAGSERNGKAAATVRKGTVAVGTAVRRYGLAARNAARQRRKARLDYVVVPIEGPLAERDALAAAVSAQSAAVLGATAGELGGVTPAGGYARRRSARAGRRVPPTAARRSGWPARRRCGAYLRGPSGGDWRPLPPSMRSVWPAISLPTACDRVVAVPAGEFNALGLHLSATFLRDTFARAGLRFEVVAVSPYKGRRGLVDAPRYVAGAAPKPGLAARRSLRARGRDTRCGSGPDAGAGARPAEPVRRSISTGPSRWVCSMRPGSRTR